MTEQNIADYLKGGGGADSFVHNNPGDRFEGVVDGHAFVQGKRMGTEELEWLDAAKTKPKMIMILTFTNVRVNNVPVPVTADDDGRRSLSFGSNKYTKLKEATKTVEHNILRGDWIAVTFTGNSDRAPKERGFNAAKLYSVEYRPLGHGVNVGGSPSVPTTVPQATTPAATASPTTTYGPKPAHITDQQWAAMPDAVKAQVSKPVAVPAAASTPAATPYGPKPAYLTDEQWAGCTDAEKAAMSPPAAGLVRPPSVPEAVWGLLTPDQQATAVASAPGF